MRTVMGAGLVEGKTGWEPSVGFYALKVNYHLAASAFLAHFS